ncbi:hypothetical protein T02_15864 [Trichinella nativa]|uniref:Uncharacterized protein n=1 Tax=Trichinella nativa TaxID=6335 RepID=A0A0V1LLJ8_9BILA|nr:hypothetical protein T02_15864 [Trichinella nativa]
MSCSREAGKGERIGIADAVRDHHRHRGEEATKSTSLSISYRAIAYKSSFYIHLTIVWYLSQSELVYGSLWRIHYRSVAAMNCESFSVQNDY